MPDTPTTDKNSAASQLDKQSGDERPMSAGDMRRVWSAEDMPPEMMEAMLKAMAEHAGDETPTANNQRA